MYGAELAERLEAPRGDVAGDDLEKLIRHLKELEKFSKKLETQGGLYLADKDGVLFGELTKSELKPIVKRIQEKITRKLKECRQEIAKHVSA
jgi:hypothetical protein